MRGISISFSIRKMLPGGGCRFQWKLPIFLKIVMGFSPSVKTGADAIVAFTFDSIIH